MKSTHTLITVIVLAVLSPIGSLHAAESANETKLREAMRNTMVQLREAQNQIAVLKAAQVESDKQKAALKEEIEKINQQALNEKEAFEKTIRGLENDKTRLNANVAELQRKVEDRERKNLALFKTAKEILTRYEKFGLGEALAAKEPFTGLTKVKLENLVQDYEDKLLDQRVLPGDKTEVKEEKQNNG